MSRFKRLIGNIEIEIDGEKFEVKPSVEDRIAMLDAFEKKTTAEKYRILYNLLVEMFKRTKQPDETEDEIKAFVDKKFEDILKKMVIAYGWASEEDIKKNIDAQLKKQTPEGPVPA